MATGPDAPPPAAIAATHARLRAAWHARVPDARQRRDDLRRLRAALVARTPAMVEAIAADFGHRSTHETLVAEAAMTLGAIDDALAHLRAWMRPRRVSAGWTLWPARAQVRPMPLGVIGIIAPWNYPVNLALMPLVSAIAAGNHVFLKPSEHTPHTSAFLCALLADVFPSDRVAVALGGADVGAAFASLPFDHLLFTGSTAVGRRVAQAAAANLVPVTLELGGKAPALVCEDYPIEQAAARIASGKWFNAGQTCIGVDYVLVDAARRDAFVAALQAELRARYPRLGAAEYADDYTRIVNDAHYARLRRYLADARARGHRVLEPLPVDAARCDRDRLLPPAIVLEPDADAALMREEIFGPILPVLSYRTLDDALTRIEALDPPLAFYPFSRDRARIERLLTRVRSGGVTVNDTLLHFGAHGLPFGGLGASGLGAIHGRAGFERFSQLLPVLHQARWAPSDWLRPPYRGRVDRLVRWLVR